MIDHRSEHGRRAGRRSTTPIRPRCPGFGIRWSAQPPTPACWTSPTARWTPRSGRCCWPRTEQGLVRVAFDLEDHDLVLVRWRRRSARASCCRRRGWIGRPPTVRILRGARKTFDLPLDFRLSAGSVASVLAHLPDIAYGQTESYAQVAAATGNPRAVRAVGSACATNPLPVVVPCHRVVRSDGSLRAVPGRARRPSGPC